MSQPYILCQVDGSDPADEWLRLGIEAHAAGNLPLAQHRYGQALRLDPRHATATQNLAIVFAQSTGFINEALLTIERAEMLDPSKAVIPTNRALMALAADRIDEALDAAQRAVAMNTGEVAPKVVLAMVLTTAGRASEALPLYNEVLDKEPGHPLAGPNSCFIQTLTNATPAELRRQRQRWYDANRYRGEITKHGNDRTTDRPIRVGYVGGDFKSHSASFIFGRVLLHHSIAIEPYLYSSLVADPAADGMCKRYRDLYGERFRDISAMTDDDAAALIRKDGIDILVDLAAHTGGGRLPLFTRKPAPIQVTAWGFAHGTGCPEIDYFFADPVAVPESERQHYAEKIVDLPCIVTMEPPPYDLKGVSLPPIRKNGYFTFGSYGRYEKMSDECLTAFGEILRRVPDSKLILKDNGYRRPYAIRRALKLLDVPADRVLFSINTSHMDHLLAYQQCDLALDPFWHGGGVVSLEQLFMSIPLVTLYGPQPSGRSASSVLMNVGRSDWVAHSTQEYIDMAVEWSSRTKELAVARTTLRQELLDSSVVAGYVGAVEAEYREVWKEYCGR